MRNWIYSDSENGRGKEEAGAIVCRGAREEEFLSITVRGGRGFLSGEVASDVTAARSQVGQSNRVEAL